MNQPIITYASDSSTLFETVQPSLEKGIGSEAVEWKRAYGRSTKHVHLHPKFIEFPDYGFQQQQSQTDETTTPAVSAGASEDLAEDFKTPSADSSKKSSTANTFTLLDLPMLHSYWTDCSDPEVYRSTVKDNIQTWLNSVRSNQSVKEWIIIVVESSDGSKKPNKLLPSRSSSVLDKIKNDFAQKQTERVTCLSDPTRMDSKLAESLHALLHRIRQLLLASYSKVLTRFEENMRAQREKRNEPGWNYCRYFLVQEELAFVLEMLQVYDEALVQYDELDALFTQFVLNSHLTDTPQWLLSFQRHSDSWPALNLTMNPESSQKRARDSIRNSSVSLLSFRNYLYSRQAALLMKQGLHAEVAQRALSFLHNSINELAILDVTFSEEGSVACWVFVACLEVLRIVAGRNSTSEDPCEVTEQVASVAVNRCWNAADFSVHTAALWDYARDKLYVLGEMGGLLPTQTPKSDHLHKVLSLAAGLEEHELPCHEESKVEDPSLYSPTSTLKSALGSKEKFEKTYLELCELAMGTYKHLGRLRSARKVGLSLAHYYMEAEQWLKAIAFLIDALKTFKDESWELLATQVYLKLAQCYKMVGDSSRYIRTCAHLACCTTSSNHGGNMKQLLSEEKRVYFFNEMMTLLKQLKDNEPLLVLDPSIAFLHSVSLKTEGKLRGPEACDVSIDVELESKFPKPVLCDKASMAIIISEIKAPKNEVLNISASGAKSSPVVEKANEPAQTTILIDDFDVRKKGLKFGQIIETKVDSRKPQVGKILCHDAHHVLRRKDSQSAKTDASSIKGNFSLAAIYEDIKNKPLILHPGKNILQLGAKILTPGTYRLDQLSLLVDGKLEILCLPVSLTNFVVERVPVTIEVVANSNKPEPLIAGIEQTVTLSIETGSFHITKDMFICLRAASRGLQLKCVDESSAPTEFQTEINIPLQQTEPFSKTLLKFLVLAELAPQKDASLIEHKIIAKCPWTNAGLNLTGSQCEEKKIPLSFSAPFMSTHKLHSVQERKFLQIVMHGLIPEETFMLSDHQLNFSATNPQAQKTDSCQVPIVPLNPRGQELTVTEKGTASYMFEIGVAALNLDEFEPLRLEFGVSFYRLNDQETCCKQPYKYYVCLNNFKTLYELNANVEPHKGLEFCRVSNMCTLFIEIRKIVHKTQKDSNPPHSLMYEVRADQHLWAICGRSSGVITMDQESSEDSNNLVTKVSVDVMPMSPGFLPFPAVHLSKYIIPSDSVGKGTGSASTVPKLEPFNIGQVYNASKGMQVHVLPPPPTSQMLAGAVQHQPMMTGTTPIPVGNSEAHF